MLFAIYLLELRLVPQGVSSAPDKVSISDSTISGIQKLVPSGGRLSLPATLMLLRTGDGSNWERHNKSGHVNMCRIKVAEID